MQVSPRSAETGDRQALNETKTIRLTSSRLLRTPIKTSLRRIESPSMKPRGIAPYYRWNSQDGDFELKQGYEYNGEGKYNTPPKGTSTAQDPAKAAAARLKKLWLLFMVGLGRSMAEFLEEAKTAWKLVRADAENAKSKAATEGSGNGEEDEESVIEEEIESVEEGEMEEEETKHSPSPRRGTVSRKR